MSRPDCDRLNCELAILYDVEVRYKIPAAPIARQLIAESERPLPDILPRRPVWLKFEWPMSGEIDYRRYWQSLDRQEEAQRRGWSPWMKETL